ncbi:DNA polymerase III subunit gamma/tau [Tepidimonas aquatica]|uniref:DNA polymerase III subunit gamma/tau n=1 Tax=Tepidimonas aquatica TaxID=247482 RepID=A0A554WM97_9BURK|nr:DNA polymerase III subunit gamma/tau [Tepidimonas aquatica]TSE24699.1 DNA polymerase III subunit tau [Tepidimonas aquatica]
MTYVVLARKYRPKTFAEMVGQEHVVQALGNALRSARLHHAYLFTGTRGIGKTTVSRILAKSLNCTGPDGQGGITDTPCGVCEACRAIDAGRFVDYTELDAASNRGVDEVQTLLEQAVYKPVQGRFKVFMIDEVHMLTNTAFNAMLKTLEEPPEYLKFVLATTDPQKVPVTVLSRCLQFNLRPMAPDTVADHLARVLAAEGIEAEPGALKLLGRAARGSMRDALSLADQAIAYGGGAVREAQVRAMLGAVQREHVTALLQAVADGQAADVVRLVDAMRAEGVGAAATLEEMAAVLHQLAVLQWTGQAPAGDEAPAAVRALAAQLAPDQVQLLYSLALHGRAELGLAPDEYAALTMVLLRALSFAPTPPVAGSSDTAPVAPHGAASDAPSSPTPRAQPDAVPDVPLAAVPVPATAPAQPAPTDSGVAPAFDGGALADEWAALVDRLDAAGRLQALVRELALQSTLVARDAHGWRLRCASATLAQDGARQRLQSVLAEQLGLGEGWTLTVEVGPATDTPAQRHAAARAARQRAAQQAIESDPVVQALQRDWGAVVVAGSIEPLDDAAAA